jgi:hypothetical protein
MLMVITVPLSCGGSARYSLDVLFAVYKIDVEIARFPYYCSSTPPCQGSGTARLPSVRTGFSVGEARINPAALLVRGHVTKCNFVF